MGRGQGTEDGEDPEMLSALPARRPLLPKGDLVSQKRRCKPYRGEMADSGSGQDRYKTKQVKKVF